MPGSTTLKTHEENPNGLHQRYIVSKANGQPVDENAVYFLLRLDGAGNDKPHINASREAALAWCDSVQDSGDASPMLRQVAAELRVMVSMLSRPQ